MQSMSLRHTVHNFTEIIWGFVCICVLCINCVCISMFNKSLAKKCVTVLCIGICSYFLSLRRR